MTDERRTRTVEEIATRLFGVDTSATRRRVQRLFATRELRGRLIGRRWVAHVDDIDAFERGTDTARATA